MPRNVTDGLYPLLSVRSESVITFKRRQVIQSTCKFPTFRVIANNRITGKVTAPQESLPFCVINHFRKTNNFRHFARGTFVFGKLYLLNLNKVRNSSELICQISISTWKECKLFGNYASIHLRKEPVFRVHRVTLKLNTRFQTGLSKQSLKYSAT